jgi:hypothetical protein
MVDGAPGWRALAEVIAVTLTSETMFRLIATARHQPFRGSPQTSAGRFGEDPTIAPSR